MAQSVVEVMEDAKGMAQENLLANGGRSLQSSSSSPFSDHSSPSGALAVAPGGSELTAEQRLYSSFLARGTAV